MKTTRPSELELQVLAVSLGPRAVVGAGGAGGAAGWEGPRVHDGPLGDAGDGEEGPGRALAAGPGARLPHLGEARAGPSPDDARAGAQRLRWQPGAGRAMRCSTARSSTPTSWRRSGRSFGTRSGRWPRGGGRPMNALDLFAQPGWRHLVFALLHTLWQGAVLALAGARPCGGSRSAIRRAAIPAARWPRSSRSSLARAGDLGGPRIPAAAASARWTRPATGRRGSHRPGAGPAEPHRRVPGGAHAKAVRLGAGRRPWAGWRAWSSCWRARPARPWRQSA